MALRHRERHAERLLRNFADALGNPWSTRSPPHSCSLPVVAAATGEDGEEEPGSEQSRAGSLTRVSPLTGEQLGDFEEGATGFSRDEAHTAPYHLTTWIAGAQGHRVALVRHVTSRLAELRAAFAG